MADIYGTDTRAIGNIYCIICKQYDTFFSLVDSWSNSFTHTYKLLHTYAYIYKHRLKNAIRVEHVYLFFHYFEWYLQIHQSNKMLMTMVTCVIKCFDVSV